MTLQKYLNDYTKSNFLEILLNLSIDFCKIFCAYFIYFFPSHQDFNKPFNFKKSTTQKR